MIKVNCRCGEIELTISGDPIAQIYCHCDDCQAIHGAAYASESVYSKDDLSITAGNPKSWTLKRNPRYFCDTCGTKLFIEVNGLNLRGINGYLLPDGAFQAQYHMNCKFAAIPVRDSIPHYAALAPQFGGPDETVDW
ncbi:GFA family protein [Agrobacterium vitis]|uniref:GFA family protein n=1 Tax=Agrobacterium vitis TaxID=373 RepID=UPI0012E99283|nr:GFA family protein [Agrobacterium vitis]MVA25346.1 aldehyde-activating protein [Agrobacterium vitis]